MQFSSDVFDAKTLAQLKKIVDSGVDRWGEDLDLARPVRHEGVLRCLTEEPMRLRQIAVRLEARRDKLEQACDELVRRRKINLDGEGFYSLNAPRLH